MKKLLLLFSLFSFYLNAQVVTISVFQTQDLTSLDSSLSVREVINNPDFFSSPEMIMIKNVDLNYSEIKGDGLKYIIDFNTKVCTVISNGFEAQSCDIKVVNKKSDSNFEINFIIPDDPSEYGLVVNNGIAAYFNRFRTVNVINFTTFFIN
jgi:hypothetical protein